MPTYDYVCDACGHELEVFQSINDRPKKKCPACGAMKLYRRIGSGAGVIFKGSGFYETDYRSASYQKGAKAESEATKDSGEKGEGKQDSGKKDAGKQDSAPSKSSKKNSSED